MTKATFIDGNGKEHYTPEALDAAQGLIDAVNDLGRSVADMPDQQSNAEFWADVLAIAIVNSPNLHRFLDRVEKKGARAGILTGLGFGYRAGLRAARKAQGGAA